VNKLNSYKISYVGLEGSKHIEGQFLTICWPCIIQWFLVTEQVDAQILFNVFIYLFIVYSQPAHDTATNTEW